MSEKEPTYNGHEDTKITQRAAELTGVEKTQSDEYTGYHEQPDVPQGVKIDTGKWGDSADYKVSSGRDLETHITESIVTENAAVDRDSYGEHNGYSYVKTHEPTGVYSGLVMGGEGDRAVVSRVVDRSKPPEGDNVYTAKLGAEAAQMVSKRANRRVRAAVADRAENIAERIRSIDKN